MTQISILVLPGDGIGPEVTSAAMDVLRAVSKRFGHQLTITDALIGGAAIKKQGTPLSDETVKIALERRATFLGAVGLPEFDKVPPDQRPEKGLLTLRAALDVYANLRPVRTYDSLLDASPLKSDRVRGIDLMIVRELTGGLYYGEPRSESDHQAVNTMTYTRSQIERVARTAFDLARKRRRKVASVDKANVLEVSRLWRRVVTQVGQDYPDVELEHVLVDNCAMQLILDPRRFDVVLTENMFGDILSDETAVLAGSIGLLPSASLGAERGLYEPIHGSAPDIAGQNKANPMGAIGSVASMLRYSFDLEEDAVAIERAIARTIDAGCVTADLACGRKAATTSEVARAVSAAI